MKLTFILLMVFMTYQYAFGKPSQPSWMKKSGWKNIELYVAMSGATEKDLSGVTPATYGAYWAGRLTEFYWDKNKSAVIDVKIRVTWTSDKGEPCGSIVTMPVNGFKDFNFRSLAMKECK